MSKQFEFLPALGGIRGGARLTELELSVVGPRGPQPGSNDGSATRGAGRAQRGSGGSGGGHAVRPPQYHSTTHKLHRSRGLGHSGVDARDLSGGVLSCVQRGLIPAQFDLGAVLSDAGGGGGGGGSNAIVSAHAAPMHKHIEQFRRQDIMTADLGLAQFSNVKLDAGAIARIPRDATAASLAAKDQPAVEIPSVLPTPAAPALSKPPAADPASTKEREDVRTYTELLDLYSLHEFIIRKGVALRNTPEFVSYQRSYKALWGPIAQAIGDLEALLQSYSIPIAYVDGKKLAALAGLDIGKPSKEELLACLANRADVEPLMVSHAQQFNNGKSGHHAAAARIQSIVRMFLQQRAYRRLRLATAAALRIQRQWNVYRQHMNLRRTLAAQRETLFARWKDTMSHFAANWPRIRDGRKVIIHLFSWSIGSHQAKSTPFFNQQQSAQLARLAGLMDDNTEMVIVSPYKIDASDALGYYYDLLSSAGVSAPQARVINLVPEYHGSKGTGKALPDFVSVSRALLCSPKLMRSLVALVRGKSAFIVPGIIGPEDHLLAATLNLPILAPDPRIALALGSKSGARSLFDAADVIYPIGAHHLQTAHDVFVALGRLVADYPIFPRWLIKLDHEFGGRGTAYLDARRLRTIELLESSGAPLPPPAVLAQTITEELIESQGRRIRLVTPGAYPDWAAFAAAIPIAGCCVEAVPAEVLASPVANLLIEPDGQARLMSVQEQFFTPPYVVCGHSHPHNPLVPFEAIREAALNIAAAAYRKRVIGYMSVDFIAFKKGPDAPMKLWAVDVKLRLTTAAATHSLIALVAGAQYDPQTGQCVVPSITSASSSPSLARSGSTGGAIVVNRPLHYVYTGLLYHPYIAAIRHVPFFGLCRQRGLNFDSVTKTGVVYHLANTLLSCAIGAAAIGSSDSAAVASVIDFLDVLQQQLVAANAPFDEHNTNVTSIVAAARNFAQRMSGAKRGGAAGGAGGAAARSLRN